MTFKTYFSEASPVFIRSPLPNNINKAYPSILHLLAITTMPPFHMYLLKRLHLAVTLLDTLVVQPNHLSCKFSITFTLRVFCHLTPPSNDSHLGGCQAADLYLSDTNCPTCSSTTDAQVTDTRISLSIHATETHSPKHKKLLPPP